MTNKEITQYSAPVVQAYRDMEDELLMLIGRQIAKDGRLSDTSKWRVRQLARAGEINRQALDIISSYSEGISNEVYDAITEAAESEVGRLDEAMLNLLSEKGELTGDVQGMLNAYERQSRQELNVKNAEIAGSYAHALSERCNLVNTVMAANVKAGYTAAVSEISRAMNEMNAGAAAVVSGNEGLHEATRRTIHRLARDGISGFTDKAGRQWTPEAYVKMDLRTTMANTARAAQDARCDAYGISLIEVSSHMGARPKCAPYQGRVFSRDGSRGVTEDLNGEKIEYIPLSETSYGEPDGLFGINCGHQQYPFIPGLSVKSYYPYPKEENAERYRELQAQRGMERKIRADKRECMMLQAAGDGDGLKEAAVRLRQDKSKYTDYCKAHGLGVHNENTQVYGYDRSKSMKTVWAEREKNALTGDSNGGIIGNKDSSFDFYPVSNDVLQKGINFNVFNNDELNSSVEAGMMEILNTVSPFTPGTEAGLTIKLSDCTMSDIILGEIGSGTIDIPERDYAYLAIHNHASGETFSFSDILMFHDHRNCKYSCVVGNNGKTFVLEKTDSYNETGFYEKIMRRHLGFEPYTADNEYDFIKECEQYGIRYIERGYLAIS